MNSCNFIGIIEETPVLENNNGVKYVLLHVNIEEIKKGKGGDKKKMYNTLCFEAWDSGAETICANCSKGTLIAIEASARFDQESEETYFRINNFKVLS